MWCVSCACTSAIEFESCQGRARQAAEPEGGGVPLPGGPRARRLSLAQREICAATRPGNPLQNTYCALPLTCTRGFYQAANPFHPLRALGWLVGPPLCALQASRCWLIGASPPRAWRGAGGGGGRTRDDREAASAGTARRPGRAGSTSLGGETTRPDAAALARGVGRGIAGGGVNGTRQKRRDGGGAAAEEA